MQLSEDLKLGFPHSSYTPNKISVWQEIVLLWGVDEDFVGNYNDDHLLLRNKSGQITCWRDKYTTALYTTAADPTITRYELQPLQDYIRWVYTQELHYLPIESRQQIDNGVWNEIPGLFLPTKVLELCFKVLHEPSANNYAKTYCTFVLGN